jgi:serine protease Do
MRNRVKYPILVLGMIVLGFLAVGCTGTPKKQLTKEEATAEVFKTCAPGVVYAELIVENNNRQAQTMPMSGIIISNEGYILIPYYIPTDAEDRIKRISVWMDSKEYKAQITQSDESHKLSVLKIESTELPKLTVLSFDDSDKVVTADWLINIASSGKNQNFQKYLSTAMVSGKQEMQDYSVFVMQATKLYMGTPFLNLDGKIVAWVSPDGHSIVGNEIKKCVDNLIAKGPRDKKPTTTSPSTTKPTTSTATTNPDDKRMAYIGFNYGLISDDYAEALGFAKEGVVISAVFPNSPVDKAGMRKGDVLVEINGKAIRAGTLANTDISNWKRGVKVDQENTFKIVRDENGEKVTKTIQFKTVEKPDPKEFISTDIGIRVQEITDIEFYGKNLTVKEGVLVTKVTPGSPAAITDQSNVSNIYPNDIIIEVNKDPTPTVDAFIKAVNKIKEENKSIVLIKLWRGNRIAFAPLNMELGKEKD